MTNMPIKRFADFLWRRGELEEYMSLLVNNFNVGTTDHLMCKDTLSVNYDGAIFDCDFNQQLDLPLSTTNDDDVVGGAITLNNGALQVAVGLGEKKKNGLTVFDVRSTKDLQAIPICHDNHCFGCTAGMGSS
mmetsp:Transcript_4868/g.15955  ORF Transcript_4868/g.15955 Transcript_4868/m.15955 type:complete len:132 (+) Transcript_4868:1057-1452(+)